ncbi:MAG: DUF421 domain-containing protein [Actinomycetota bacterium]|nr:DUF421 domain-containing protein [Actinomycetota bacterium]
MTAKRGLSGLNTLDIVVIMLLSNVVQNAIIGNDLSITGAAIGATTLVLVNSLMNRAALRSAFVARIFDGSDTCVIEKGAVHTNALRRIGMSRATLEHAVRSQNGDSVEQVESGVLEPGGQLLLTLRGTEQSATKADVDALQAQLDRIENALARH